MKNAQAKPKVPFHLKLVTLGICLAIAFMMVDVSWPVYRLFNYNWPLSILLAIGSVLLSVIGVMFTTLAGIAARKGKAASASPASSGSNGTTATPGPAGQTVTPKQNP